MNFTVCLATCNGRLHIERQLNSILNQTLLPDEIIIVDDNSEDDTVSIVSEILDPVDISSLVVVNKTRLGVNKTFEKCMRLASYQVILISDQDDFWFPKRIENIDSMFSANPLSDLVLVNAAIERDGKLTNESISDFYPYTDSIIKNFIVNRYTGCQMAVRKEFVASLFPFPSDRTCYYDHWISVWALKKKSAVYLNEHQGYYCRHSNNVTDLKGTRSLLEKISSRSLFILVFLSRYFKRRCL